MTGAQAIIESLLEEQVDFLFGIPGGAIMPVYDALYDAHCKIRHILARHEQGAVHAAEGYARVTGKPGVCLATAGPGATNLLTGIADAMSDSVPLVCITGQVASSFLGTHAFQEADILSMTMPVTKWCHQITCSNEIPKILAKAFSIARSGRPGPVLVDITKDAQVDTLDFKYQKMDPSVAVVPVGLSPGSSPGPSQGLLKTQFQKAAQLINQAKKPFLLVGHGVLIAQAEQELLDFATKANIPVACTLLGLSAFPPDHPLYVGLLGMHGNYAANLLTNQADVIIAVGMRFDDRVTGNLSSYAKQAKIIHIEIDPAELNKTVLTDVGLLCDAKSALRKLALLIHSKNHSDWLHEFKLASQIEYQEVILPETRPSLGKLKMAEVMDQLSVKTLGKALLVTDVGQHQMIAARYYRFHERRSHLTSGGLGTMGYALPAAIGAKLAASDRHVIVISGDGGFQMNIQELGVIAQENLPIKIIILNNGFLGMVRQWQELFFNQRYSFSQLKNPDFVKIAESYGIAAQKLSDRKNLSQALDEMLDATGPYLLEVAVEEQENVFPMIPSGAGVSDVRLC